MDVSADRTLHLESLGATSAGAGAVAWLAAPWLPAGAPPAAGSIGHLFLLMPLVAAPLALDLLASLRGEDGGAGSPSRLLGLARRVQPVAAGLVLWSFCIPSGGVAGVLSVPWLGLALMVAAGGATGIRLRRDVVTLEVSPLAAGIFFLVGAAWLVLWRLGLGPRGFSPLTVSLAALHFHFNGFAAQALFAATSRRLGPRSPPLRALHRLATVAAIAGLPLLAAGKALQEPAVRAAGVSVVTLGLVGLCVTTTAVAVAARSGLTRHLLLASAACAGAAMGLAAVFGAGELAGQHWIGLGRMVATHGVLMSVGFTLCGLLGHLRSRRG